MNKLARRDLFSLEDYARQRAEFRARVMEHKAHRRLPLGPHLTLYFEDRLTIQYQVQEMLRAERIFEEAGINDELAAYNPLIPDGTNWKATMMIEYADPAERARALERLVGIENKIWMQVDNLPPVTAIADEDLDRATETKTSAVHFLRFELTPGMITALKSGASIAAGVDHPTYSHRVEHLAELLRESLVADLD
jgi:hypothetical protein